MFITEKIISIFAPHTCLRCGIEGALLCNTCRMEAILPVPSRCYRCFTATKDFAVCKSCQKQTKLRQVWVASEYEGVAKDLLHYVKFERAQAGAAIIAVQLNETLPYLSNEVTLVHVPTATSRARQRGYDQAQLITKELAHLQKIKASQLLVRMGQARQVGAKRELRKTQLANAFRIYRSYKALPAHVVLVDDVLTTGATLESVAGILRQSGVRRVDAVVFAQKH
jgi:ComF family protein